MHIRGKDNQIADTLSHSLQVVSYLGCYNITKPCLYSSSLQCIRNKLGRAKARLGEAYSQFTSRSYQKFRTFVAFCCFASVSLSCLSVDIILALMEFLTFNKISHPGLIKHISAIKTILANFGLDISCFNDQRIRVYNKAIMKHPPLHPHIKTIINIEMLSQLVCQCDKMFKGVIYKTTFLTSFFSFMRISNLVPHSISLLTV